MQRADSLAKTLVLEKTEGKGQEEKGATEDEMVGWSHWLNGHEFEQAPGDNEGQGSLACSSPWGHRVKHNLVTERQQQHKDWGVPKRRGDWRIVFQTGAGLRRRAEGPAPCRCERDGKVGGRALVGLSALPQA